MPYAFKEYDELKGEFAKTTDYFLKHYRVDSLEGLEEPRRSQMIFLTDTLSALDKQPSKNYSNQLKAFIATGAFYIVREQIRDTYTFTNPSGNYLSSGSDLFVQLGTALGLEGLGDISPHERMTAITKAFAFLGRAVLVDRDSAQGFKDNHPYSNCEDQMSEVWSLLAARSQSTMLDILRINAEITQKNRAETQSVSSSSMFQPAKKGPELPEDSKVQSQPG